MRASGQSVSVWPGVKMISLSVILIISYLLGSIPTSIIVGKLTKGIDIRQYGSGNAGGTNAFRVLGWKAGIIVSLFDIFKGFASAYWVSRLRIDTLPFESPILPMILAGIAAILGHTFTIFAGFRGGKGVATGAGMLIAIYPLSVIICILVFALVLFSTGIVSISSMSAAVSLPVSVWLISRIRQQPIDTALLVFSLLIPLFIIFTHRTNIQRLINGTENRFDKLILWRKLKHK